MKLAELKSDFHALIDQIDDPNILSQFYDVMSQSAHQQNSMWQSLSASQQKALLEAYEDSENEDNLIPFSQIKEKYREWPLK